MDPAHSAAHSADADAAGSGTAERLYHTSPAPPSLRTLSWAGHGEAYLDFTDWQEPPKARILRRTLADCGLTPTRRRATANSWRAALDRSSSSGEEGSQSARRQRKTAPKARKAAAPVPAPPAGSLASSWKRPTLVRLGIGGSGMLGSAAPSPRAAGAPSPRADATRQSPAFSPSPSARGPTPAVSADTTLPATGGAARAASSSPAHPSSPQGQSPTGAGLERFGAVLGAALQTLPVTGMEQKWDAAASMLDRVRRLAYTWGDAECSSTEQFVRSSLAKGQDSKEGDMQKELSHTAVAGACAAMCSLMEALVACAPALGDAIRCTVSRVLAAVYAAPPVLPPDWGTSSGNGASWDCYGAFLGAGPWCQRTKSNGAPDGQLTRTASMPHAITTVGKAYSQQRTKRSRSIIANTGVTSLLEDAVGALCGADPDDACEFLAAHFSELASQSRVDVSTARAIVTEEATAYFSRKLCMGGPDGRAQHTEAVESPLSVASQFGWFSNQRSLRGHKYNASSLHRNFMYPVQKRLAYVFLDIIGRTDPPPGRSNSTRSWDRDLNRDQLFHVPPVTLRIPISEWSPDDERELVINHTVIDRAAARCIDDEMFREHYPEGTGPPAEVIYGSAEFRLTRSRVRALEQSTRVVVSGPLTARFLCELARFTTDPKQAWLFSTFRSAPLQRIGSGDVITGLQRMYGDRYDQVQRQVKSLQDENDKLWQRWRVANEGERRRMVDKLADADHQLHQHRLWRDDAKAHLQYLRRGELRKISEQFASWLKGALRCCRDYGYETRHQVQQAAQQSLAELATHLCLSQQGYFFVDGTDGAQNQLCACTPQPITFLSATGLDFNNHATTLLEAQKYFHPDTDEQREDHTGWYGFLEGAEMKLLERVKHLYIAIFTSAQHHGVRNISMLGIGLGAFLKNVHSEDRVKVRELYLRAQFELLSERDWGFHNYFLNAAQWNQLAREVLELGLRSGAYNDPKKGHFLRCSVVVHTRDAKFIGVELAKRQMSAGVLNPSDCSGLLMGCFGNHWETGRCGYYGGEEDFAATSTGLLAHSGISDTMTNIGRCVHVDTATQRLARPIRGEQDYLDLTRATALSPVTVRRRMGSMSARGFLPRLSSSPLKTRSFRKRASVSIQS